VFVRAIIISYVTPQRFEALAAVKMSVLDFWVATSYGGRYGRFGEAYSPPPSSGTIERKYPSSGTTGYTVPNFRD
jgi:hypothetical protein